MKLPFSPSFVAGALCAALLPAAAGILAPQDQSKPKDQQPSPEQIGQMMMQAAKFTKPGKHHKELERFLGKWNTETRMTGSNKTEKGTAEYGWLMEGRWLKGENKTALMGMPFQSFYVVGYDNFKQSFVTCAVNSLDTAMLHSEGDMDPGGKTLLTYGTLDEYLTGEVGKMVKYVWRFESADRFVIEVHDLPIGEHNTKVFEIVHTRDVR